MADQKIKLEQNSFDKAFRVKWTGGHSIAVILILLTIMMNTCAVEHHLNKSNELRKLQLDQAKRQYSLDSLRFEYAKQHQK
ncbi:MAG: hypothetical protein J6Q44_01435 [Alphaproteobacteria bacterium]|jgi:hypothetical protein|nr:hypothetical protein [Alphaproteobacteria bacterium]